MTLNDLWGHTSLSEKFTFLKDKALNKKYIAEKDYFEVLRGLYVTFNELWGHTVLYKNLRLHNVSIHRNVYQNRFINEYARKKRYKIPESQSFLVRYRRTCALKNYIQFYEYF